MEKKIFTLSLIVMLTGLLLVNPAYAHNFVKDQNSDLIAKIQGFKTESNLIANNISNSTLSQWHITKSQEYFGTNELVNLSTKNSTLSSDLSTAIDDLYSLSGKTGVDPAVVAQKITILNQLLDQAESIEISSSDQNNATVQSLSIIDVTEEVLRDYGVAIGSTVDLTNMSNMNMQNTPNNMQGMGGMQSSGMSSVIVNVAAYQSSLALADTAQSMFNNLKSIAPPNSSPYLDKIGVGITDLKQALNNKQSGNDVMTIVHTKIHPNFISAFNIQAVPEFPIPILLVAVSSIGIIVISRVLPKILQSRCNLYNR